jgi:hypothetical protein
MELLTMGARRLLFSSSLFGASLLFACTDGKLEVLERSEEAGAPGTGGTSSPPFGGSGGGGGSGASAGAAGKSTGGSAGMLPVSPFPVDDFEDGNTECLIGGYWYGSPDPTCTIPFSIESVTNRPGSTRGIRAHGSGCSVWGALLGVDLRGPEPKFDTSSFTTLRFWARAEPGSVTEINVSLLEDAHFDTTIELTSDWQEFNLPLSGFVWNDMGDAHPLDRTAVEHLQFFVFSSAAFDFWIDDVAFVR